LDIGCGDGSIASLIAGQRPDLSIMGVEVLVRPETKVACQPFDGEHLPFPDGAFDLCMLVDVLHHTPDVKVLLKEACRVSKAYLLLKDHLDENVCDNLTLRVMDWIGNRPYGVSLTYNYQSRALWEKHFAECGLVEASYSTDIPMYPAPVSWIAGRNLHFISLLER
jgi:ubiquinone/menaquinone biosynthesis C-methylase UbiE